MFFAYRHVDHPIGKMQTYIDYIFLEVWCRASQVGPFNLELFNGCPELKEVLEAFQEGGNAPGLRFYNLIRDIHNLFIPLQTEDIELLQTWYKGNNSIEKICSNDPEVALVRYNDVEDRFPTLHQPFGYFFKNLYNADLLGAAALKKKIGDFQSYYKAFTTENRKNKCPFCGIGALRGIYHTIREAYDHYLPKAIYPFNSINLDNLAPACNECNSAYKLSADPLFCQTRRKAFYPFASNPYQIEIRLELKKGGFNFEPDDIHLSFGPESLEAEIETWKDVYKLEERYKAVCCGEQDGKYWLIAVLDEWRLEGKTPEEYLRTLARETQKFPFAECNFLKKAFLDGCERVGLLRVPERPASKNKA